MINLIVSIKFTGMDFVLYICDLLSENPAHPAFDENPDKTGNQCIDV